MALSKISQFKAWLKRNRTSSNFFLRWGIKIFDAFVSFVRTIKGLLTNKDTRAIYYNRIFHSKRIHQTTSSTCLNRYPEIFYGCMQYFEGRSDIRILSFGCSTGEEVITLRQYFPDAQIVGAEINKNSLEICRKRKLDDKISFVDSLPEEIQKHAPFDAILCMAVLQRTPGVIAEKGITDLKKIYPFEKFEDQIIELDGYLKPGGLMVVHMSQYDFTDTKLASNYNHYGDYNQDPYGPYVFDFNSKLKAEHTGRHSIFIKNR